MEIKNIFSLGELFERVQTENIFPDNKTFVDCTPNSDLTSIQLRYESEKSRDGFNLSDFVSEHFTLPKNYSTDFISDRNIPVTEHIEKLWDVLTRQPEQSHNSLIPLPHSYIVPGGRFREIYYWDSYFTMLGLQISKRVDLIQDMVDNFSYLIDHYGYIPNGNRTYFLGRSQPPFFACMIRLLAEEKGENVLVTYLPQLEKEYDFWMKGKDQVSPTNPTLHHVVLMSDRSILNHYWDESDAPRPEAYKHEVELAKNAGDKKMIYRNLRAAAESGWDFSSRWFKNKQQFSSIEAADIVPVDLNCLLLNLEQTIAEAYRKAGNNPLSEKFQRFSETRKQAIDQYCWNGENGFYYDYDYVGNHQKDALTLAAAFPLFFKLASAKQAAGVAEIFKKQFLNNGGLVTTLEKTNQQWDWPNGWAPLQWIAIKGLSNYGHFDLAVDIATRWIHLNQKVYKSTGKLMEKYNVIAIDLEAGGGEYPAQDGFGWTNGVYLALEKWLKDLPKTN